MDLACLNGRLPYRGCRARKKGENSLKKLFAYNFCIFCQSFYLFFNLVLLLIREAEENGDATSGKQGRAMKSQLIEEEVRASSRKNDTESMKEKVNPLRDLIFLLKSFTS